MSRCDFKISRIVDDGGSNVVITYTVHEGDITTVSEWRMKADGDGSEEVDVTAYRRTSILQSATEITLPKTTYVADLKTILNDNFVTGSRTAIDEQAV